jgi:sugar (pentulose or hexulose) kinase
MPKSSLIAALDLGTSSVKGALFRCASGASTARLASARAPLAPPALNGLRAEQSPADIAAQVTAVLERLTREEPATAWAALGLTTQRGTLLPLDAAGAPVGPLISWLDRRPGELERPGDRWSWVERQAPDIASRTARLGSVLSWICQRLTGEILDTAQTAPPEAGRAGPAAPLKPVGHVAPVDARSLWAKALGLPGGLPVVIAGGDKNSELAGAGVVAPGAGVVSFGTAVSLGILLPPAPPAEGALAGVFLTPAHDPRFRQAEIGLPFGGGVWTWIEGLFGQAAAAICDEDLTDQAPLFLPYLMGSLTDPAASGSWIGLNPSSTPRMLAATGLEGIVHDLLAGRSRLGTALPSAILTGGGTRSPVLAQWLADALACEVEVAAAGETGAAGAAMAAALGVGVAGDWGAAVRAFCPPSSEVRRPRPPHTDRWQRRHRRWLGAPLARPPHSHV